MTQDATGGSGKPLPPVRVPPPQAPATSAVQGRLAFQETSREIVRAMLALAALALVFTTVIMAFLATAGTVRWTAAKEWLQVVLPAETGILGSVLGFYFGALAGEQRRSRGSGG